MSSREDTPEPGTSSGQAAPGHDAQESAACPECRDISTACSSSCRHCFCQLCLWDWSLGAATCPRCQRPTRHPYPQHVALYHEVQDRVYDRKRRWRPRSCSGPWERRRRRRRSVRWPRDGGWRSRGSDSPRRRWWQQQRRAWEDVPEEGRAPRLEWAIAASSRGRGARRRPRRWWSQQELSRAQRRERCRGWDGRQSSSSSTGHDTPTGSQERSARQRRCRSWDVDDRHAARPQHDDRHAARPQHHVPSERSETHQSEDSDSSRRWHTRGRQSRGRSHRRGQNSQPASQGTVPREHPTRQRRSWNADDSHAPGPQHDTPSRRTERHQWEDWDSSRQQYMTRSQTRGRSHRRGRNSQGTVPRDHSTRQRQCRSWNAGQGRAPGSQQDTPGSSGSSRHRRGSWSRAGRRDT